MDGLQHVGPAVAMVILLLGIALVVCWIILPFAILGTKPLLRQLLAEQRRTNELLVQLKSGSQLPKDGGDPGAPFSALS